VSSGSVRVSGCCAALALSALMIGVSGCVSAMGSKRSADPTLVAQIKEHRTTKDEVRPIIGDPNAVSFMQDDEVWTYTYCKMTMRPTNWIPYVNLVAGGYDTQSASVTVIFDEKGVVKRVGQGRMEGGGGGIQDLKR
jgi:outer membrane protein assembly factor BamE (lipoprotein component of BamABCDE complex)